MNRQRLYTVFFLVTMAALICTFLFCYLQPGFIPIFSYLTTAFTIITGIGAISFGLLKIHEAYKYEY
ncbi:hypothetical protein [Tengunoibacter tsumagoiensis]|uniref:Uncharacterized protein n=1 Tax=Tengunoibacter tsumagoiensis TaxID=2014871 RepID=A0A402A326_9CHLR|nr:hypothetical protein [Tengunoibacter tsumagoiensis]GCE13553.1 hypothetical protein KTT_34120 [Tengunoibacter tsumagoiensis]